MVLWPAQPADGQGDQGGGTRLLYPQSPNRPPCGREEWTPDSTPHVIHILLGCFLFWRSEQKSGRRGLWLSPQALRSPEEGTGLGMWSGQVTAASPTLEWLLLTSLLRVHHAGIVRPPFTLRAIFFPEPSAVLRALGLVKAPSTGPRAAGQAETKGNRKPSCQGTRKTSYGRWASC